MNMKTTLLGTVILLSLVACGGGNNITVGGDPQTPSATSLAYQDPAPTGFRLVRSAASSGAHLVLDLKGPAGTQGKGVAFFLKADAAKVTWVHPTGVAGTCVAPGSVFPLGTAPQLLKDRVASGSLQLGLFQKGGTATTLADAPILSLALDLSSASVATGAVSLGLESGKQAVLLGADGSLSPISISVGSLSAQ